MSTYRNYSEKIKEALDKLIVTNKDREEIEVEEAFRTWIGTTNQLKKSNKTMYFIGNGASAAMASHMAVDASKLGGFRGMAFNDIAFITAIANDIAYDQAFAYPLKRFGSEGDVLVTISSSGNSPNVIAAIHAAKELGITSVTLSGMGSNNQSRQLGDLNFYVPAQTYGIVESTHQTILHCWFDLFIENEGE